MIGRFLIFAIIATLLVGSLGAALADDGDDKFEALAAVELRKDDALADAELVDDEDERDRGDGDKTRGDDGTDGGDNTGDGDGTEGNDGTGHGDNTPDGDDTAGNDGTHDGDGTGNDVSAGFGGDGTLGGGGVSYDGDTAPAAVAPAPAAAPVHDLYTDEAGYYYGGSDDGGSD